MDGLTVNEL